MSDREWEPTDETTLRRIREDTAQDAPRGDYCASEVYDLASEVAFARQTFAALKRARAEGSLDTAFERLLALLDLKGFPPLE